MLPVNIQEYFEKLKGGYTYGENGHPLRYALYQNSGSADAPRRAPARGYFNAAAPHEAAGSSVQTKEKALYSFRSTELYYLDNNDTVSYGCIMVALELQP